jgi:hypothetical protein
MMSLLMIYLWKCIKEIKMKKMVKKIPKSMHYPLVVIAHIISIAVIIILICKYGWVSAFISIILLIFSECPIFKGIFKICKEYTLSQIIFKKLLWGCLMNFGTSYKRPATLILFLWIIALPVYHHRDFIKCSNEYKAAHPNNQITCNCLVQSKNKEVAKTERANKINREDGCKEERLWSWSDAFFLSFRYHIPLLQNVTKVDFALKDDKKIIVTFNLLKEIYSDIENHIKLQSADKSSDFSLNIRITPEDFGSIMYLLNWILWPVFIALFTRWAIKQQ